MKTLTIVCILFISSIASATEAISWDVLRPQQTQSFLELSAGDQALLNEIYVYDLARQTRNLSPMEQSGYDQRVALAVRKGLDVKELLKQKVSGEKQANAVIEDLYYEEMKLPGFLVPLEMTGLVGTQFILVPTAGACIHMPPPPVNQTVLVDIPQGYELQSLYTAVWVEGSLNAESMQQSVALSDGNQAVETGYRISADRIYLYK